LELSRYIEYSLQDEFDISLQKEIFSISVNTTKKIKIEQNKKKIKVLNSSLGFDGDLNLSSNPIFLSSLDAEEIFENKKSLDNNILYIQDDLELSKLKNLEILENIVLLSNKVVSKPLYIKQFPVFFIKNRLEREKPIDIKVKTKKSELKGINYFIDFGYGSYYLYVVFPYDSYLQTVDDLSFHSSFKVLKDIIRRILKVKYPRGYRTRILIADLFYFNYAGLKNHLENINMDNVLSFVNLEGTGAGNEKLILRNNRKLLDPFTIKRINSLFSKIGFEIKKERFKNITNIDEIIKDRPIIWFYSQPNENLYNIQKEFLTDDFVHRVSSGLFYLINNLYKGLL